MYVVTQHTNLQTLTLSGTPISTLSTSILLITLTQSSLSVTVRACTIEHHQQPVHCEEFTAT